MPRITPIPTRKLRKVFEKAGFKCVRIKGDHFVYTKPGIRRPVVIPDRREVPVFIIRNNLRTANISRKEYFELLKKHCILIQKSFRITSSVSSQSIVLGVSSSSEKQLMVK